MSCVSKRKRKWMITALSQGAKSTNEVAVHDSATEDQDTSTLRHSCADSVNGVIDEDSTRTDASHMDGILPPCVLENSPNNNDTVVSSVAVDAQQNDEENKVENYQTTEEGTTSAVSTKDAEGSSISRSVEEVHEEVLDKDKLIVSLEEEVGTFFAVGSPLGVSLSLRNVRIGIGKGQDYWQDANIIEEMPCCRQMFNIFHPFDHVAYRVEPLVCEDYLKRPFIVPYHRGGKRIHVGVQEFKEDIAVRSQAIAHQLKSVKVKAVAAMLALSRNATEEDGESANEKHRSYGSIMMEKLTGSRDGRIDHVLQVPLFVAAMLHPHCPC